MFNKILIANRGEIVCRIIRTLKNLGIKSVAIYSDADANAQHVKQADEAFYVGPAPSRDSYLQSEKIIQIALKNNIDAIHPGYGFLSENADFAQRCIDAGLTFIGPTPAAIRAMGSKSAAKTLMEKVNVPLVPGYHGDKQDAEFLLSAAKKIGFPVLLKAAAGGGGKGMRVVWQEDEFNDAFAGAKREALASFNDDKLLIEKYLTKPRHVEIQVFADQLNNYVYLFERDCSIQRRHQKVIEEAPAPKLTPQIREKMGQAAIAAAKAINYTGAGTVEFLLDENNEFYFMEMNTRLQVEHSVTEMITGQDLVAWQIQAAAGKELPLTQEQLKIHGHALEVRIYAEDPNNQFLPSIGKITHFKTPNLSPFVRLDSAVTKGDPITPYYDPMIAKLIVWGETRVQAFMRMHQALNELQIIGIKTNIQFLKHIIANEDFIAENFDTGFINKHQDKLFITQKDIPDFIYAAAALFMLLKQKQDSKKLAQEIHEKNSPWFASDNWRLYGSDTQKIYFANNSDQLTVTIQQEKDIFKIISRNNTYNMTGELINSTDLLLTLDKVKKFKLTFINDHHLLHVFDSNNYYQLTIHNPVMDFEQQEEAGSGLTSPMPGTVVALLIEEGKKVNRGDKLMVIEAMKMEHTIHAPMAGKVKNIYYKVGDMVNEGAQLLAIEA